MYGIKLDLNNAMPITTEFVFSQIINVETGRYFEDSIMKDENFEVPNYLLYLNMQDCEICTRMEPIAHYLAREFHKRDSVLNTYVATIDCSEETGLFMCEYLHVHRLPKFIVLRPESENRFF